MTFICRTPFGSGAIGIGAARFGETLELVDGVKSEGKYGLGAFCGIGIGDIE